MAVVAVVVMGVLVGACGGTLGSTNSSNAQGTAATTAVTTAGAATTQAPPTVSTTPLPPASPGEASPAQSVATILGPSVVNIKVTGTSPGGNGFGQRQYEAVKARA